MFNESMTENTVQNINIHVSKPKQNKGNSPFVNCRFSQNSQILQVLKVNYEF